ncbi:unnamed protein product [Paramecium primaurelia]|uniref:Uncharacterized protein n=2 Tax=Paramecium TaxID=5884 RepID=A0A8S1ULB1_9CILI|nr:unnamed protein product [Paramecium primaurelia]CAD8164499.1 unnamed protein product [Paramecium pentaurelia]
MLPLSQNIYHRQSTSLLQKHFETRKNSPVTIIRAPALPKRQPLSGSSLCLRTPYSDVKLRMFTQQTEESKFDSTMKQDDSQNQQLSSFIDIKIDKLSCTKTTAAESVEEEKQQVKKNFAKQSYLQMQKQLLDRDLELLQLQRTIKILKDQNKKLINENSVLKKENTHMKTKIDSLEKRIEGSPTHARISEYISALTEVDKIKIESLLN